MTPAYVPGSVFEDTFVSPVSGVLAVLAHQRTTFTGTTALLTVNGATVVADHRRGGFVLISYAFDHRLHFARLDTDLAVESVWSVPVAGGDQLVWWSSSAAQVGDCTFVIHLVQGVDRSFDRDTGDLMLQVFDLDWNQVDAAQLTHLESGQGNARPSLAVDGERLLVVYDRSQRARLLPVQIDPSACLSAP